MLEDGTLRPYRHEADSHYDPRTRPFYERASTQKHRVWTPPYLFFEEGASPSSRVLAQGITCAAPIYARDGALRGVVTVDFDLEALSRFVSAIHLSPHAVVFLYTADGVVLAHPTLHVTSRGSDGPGELVTKKNIDDPLVRAFFDAPEGGTRTGSSTSSTRA